MAFEHNQPNAIAFLAPDVWSPRFDTTFYTLKMVGFERLTELPQATASSESISGHKSLPAYYYKIDVLCGTAKHTIFRRYSQFYWLFQNTLVDTSVPPPAMPPGTCLFMPQDDKFAQNRLEQLKDFMVELLQRPNISSDPAVVAFLELQRFAP